MSTAVASGTAPNTHGKVRWVLFTAAVVLLATLGTYYVTLQYGPAHTTAPAKTQTIIVYHNSTVFQNTTRNVTTPLYHNSTVWQNSTVYRNNTVYNVTTVYVNSTEVVMVPVVNVTGLAWTIEPGTQWSGRISAVLVTPVGPGFEHSYPLGTVMWVEANITNSASTSAPVTVSPGSPFVLVDSQPSFPRTIPAGSTLTVEISIGVPYSPGEYTLALNVTFG